MEPLDAPGYHGYKIHGGGLVVFPLVVLGLIILSIVGLVASVRRSRRHKKYAKSVGAEKALKAIHMDGLDFGKTECLLLLFPDKLRIENPVTNRSFEIPIESIRRSEAEQVRKNTSFSIGKAVLGEAVAGPLGAAVAGSSGGSTADGTKHLVDIQFTAKEGETKQIIFLTTHGIAAIKFSARLNARIVQLQRVESGAAPQQL